jgi:16S rRNA (cytosine1402-N4)-methyltransferase
LIGIDRDQVAIASCGKRFEEVIAKGHFLLVHAPFSQIDQILTSLALQPNVIYADLGVSSPQLDTPERGFSMRFAGPLDMRMDQSANMPTAKDILAMYSIEDLTRIFFEYGEEPKAKYYARAIDKRRAERAFEDTKEFADFLQSVNPYRSASKKHPGTKIFQALRIEVNQELAQIEEFLKASYRHLAVGGRMGVITFHSLEDRLVKNFFQSVGKSKSDPAMRHLPMRDIDVQKPPATISRPFPCVPTDLECQQNPRARSAKLRVLVKQQEGSLPWKS